MSSGKKIIQFERNLCSIYGIIKGICQFFVINLLFYLSCTQNPAPYVVGFIHTPSHIDTLPIPYLSQPDHDYAGSRAFLENQRQALKKSYALRHISIDSVGQAFTHSFLTEIIPHWFGTPWTFSGHTETPGEGSIACGYFVSTTLLHAGLNLNRYRLAQQSPADEALMLCLGDTIWTTQRDDAAKALAVWQTQLRDGLYFIGLGESHVGFLLKHHNEFYFIHSNYAGPVEVQMQRAEESVLMGFNDFYLSYITFNRRLMEYWINGEKIPLRKEGGVMARW